MATGKTGEIGILNVGAGDTKLSFDPSKPEEVKRAAMIVTDMIRRGFAILVEIGRNEKGPIFQRAQSFDPETCEYIVVGLPESAHEETAQAQPTLKGPKKTRKTTSRIPAAKTSAVAVARSAGG